MQGKDRSTQIIALVALIVAVFGLTVGFAAFTTTLTITAGADVTKSAAQSVLDVVFSSQSNTVSNTAVSITPTVSGTGATADNATLNALTVTNLFAHFTAPGQSAEYSFFVYNNSPYVAYLTAVTFNNVSGQSAKKVCTANNANSNPATQGLSDACDDISISVELGTTPTTFTDTTTTGLTGHSLTAQGGYEAVKVIISYAANGAEADGDFTVAFGDITFDYSSVSGS